MPSGCYKRIKKIGGWKLSKKLKEEISIRTTGSKNPFYGKKHSEATRKKMSERRLGRKYTPHSEKTKQKMRENNARYWLGKHQSEDTRKKRSEAMKGKNTWTRGSKRSQEAIEKTRLALKGRKRFPFSKEWCKNISIGKTGIKYPNRKLSLPFTEEHKKNMGKAHIGLKHPHSEETKQKIREWVVAHPNKVFKNTKIELKVEEELKDRKIYYEKQVSLCDITIADFYLPKDNIVIYCDGDYWHNLPGYKERDERQNKILRENGFKVYRFWEHDINKSPEGCINTIGL